MQPGHWSGAGHRWWRPSGDGPLPGPLCDLQKMASKTQTRSECPILSLFQADGPCPPLCVGLHQCQTPASKGRHPSSRAGQRHKGRGCTSARLRAECFGYLRSGIRVEIRATPCPPLSNAHLGVHTVLISWREACGLLYTPDCFCTRPCTGQGGRCRAWGWELTITSQLVQRCTSSGALIAGVHRWWGKAAVERMTCAAQARSCVVGLRGEGQLQGWIKPVGRASC
mmetsp:Transcript_56973/g.101715  ORF Transcript_56973/g.101715 Transcript_56973/m.101715 type:complete len:226 (+) Transcript_56973:200-877(+)